MYTVTITAKGKITLNKELMEYLGLPNGGKVCLEKMPDGSILITALPESLEKE